MKRVSVRLHTVVMCYFVLLNIFFSNSPMNDESLNFIELLFDFTSLTALFVLLYISSNSVFLDFKILLTNLYRQEKE